MLSKRSTSVFFRIGMTSKSEGNSISLLQKNINLAVGNFWLQTSNYKQSEVY